MNGISIAVNKDSDNGREVKIDKKDAFATKRQVGQMIRQAFERRKQCHVGKTLPENGSIKGLSGAPRLDDLEDGQGVEVDLHPAQVGPGEPLGYERRRYVRRGDRLFFYVLEEVN